MMHKDKNTKKKNKQKTKSRPKKTIYETLNFGSTERYNILKKYLYSFVIFYFDL